MKFKIDPKSLPAIVFFLFAMALLAASARTTTLAEKAADDARYGLIPLEKSVNAPDFTLPALTVGSKDAPKVNLHLAAAKMPIVFSFWASYCQYCPMEMSHLQQYSAQYKGKVQFYTVNSNDNAAMIRRYQSAHGFSLPTLYDADHRVAITYGVASLPTLIIVDKSGRVRYVSNGFDPEMDSVLPKVLDQVVKDS
jgi:thiol-disulfide isomerase/thioredoxin